MLKHELVRAQEDFLRQLNIINNQEQAISELNTAMQQCEQRIKLLESNNINIRRLLVRSEKIEMEKQDKRVRTLQLVQKIIERLQDIYESKRAFVLRDYIGK